MRHFLNLIDLSTDELSGLLAEAARLKAGHARGVPARTLAGKVVGPVFEKPSLRTRVSFESGVAQLGGTALYLPDNEVGLGGRFVLACPVGYGFDDRFRADYRAKVSPDFPAEVNDVAAAVRGADVIYTDVWTSMGQEAERDERLKRFEAFQVNAALLEKAA